jgi:hypothetical protein
MTFISASPNQVAEPAILIPNSTSWVCPVDGIYRLSALGAGASGGAIMKTTTYGGVSGGGGGGFCEMEVFLTAGLTLTITIGAGGAQAVSNVSGTGYAGNDGGDTTITGTGISMTAGGGKAGAYTTTTTTTAAGGAGGTASGGGINFAGGAGGDALYTTNCGNAAGGGAAGSPYGVGGRGGHAKRTNTSCCTGGGAVGGFAGFDNTANSTGAGGGTGGTPPTYSQPGPNRLGIPTNYSADGFLRIETPTLSIPTHKQWGFESLNDPFRCLTGGSFTSYNTTSYTGMPGPGAGGKGFSTVASTMPGNICGGGGGCFVSAAASLSGGSFMGGGSGGSTSTSTSATSEIGGPGFAVIERIA